MNYDTFFKIFITLHAIGGFISLIAGTISVIARKGNTWHKKSGMVFYYGMLTAGISGILASLLPYHNNPFLFVVGLFSVYLVLSGYRALRFKKVKLASELRYDKIISWSMLTIGLAMIFYGALSLLSGSSMGWILIIFGGIGVLNAVGDIRAMRDIASLRKKYLRLHIGKITGGYIAAFTAFFVTNQVLPALLSWLLPTIFGVLFIGYWLRKTKLRKKTTTETL
ncbi:hypothetical protein JM84_2471 [Dokdonia sp. Hel_I_63]|uniref:hypothetical protein n=1 Tax=unclassified Dokdonia TaxID=2615033 RepID=UPI00020A6DC4|nr:MULTISPECIES: hypothetical protein [unclassified Dokdonia]AEE20209.1 hypothetical protein Krodi_2228 [Dokdonia sp. 4H-3-7-5]TVZ23537.1 hypothetical protein JM84_2471 [Dokdonia sp. Hel_I_63]